MSCMCELTSLFSQIGFNCKNCHLFKLFGTIVALSFNGIKSSPFNDRTFNLQSHRFQIIFVFISFVPIR